MTRLKTIIKKRLRWLLGLIIRPLLDDLAWVIVHKVPHEQAHKVFRRHGYHFLYDHYYLPIPDETDLAHLKDSALIGLEMRDEAQFDLLKTAINPYKAEFEAFPLHKTAEDAFYVVNGAYMAVDGNVYYGLIRHFKPRHIVEIGSGHSTLLAAAAVRQNHAEGHPQGELICIEPYPRPMLRQHIPEMTQLIEQRVQDVDMGLFEGLGENDVLFIDSSHVLRAGGDVWWEYCEILPRLKPGVLVHIHDISLPEPYPRAYYDQYLYWNEQYLLQAFLAFNSRFEVLWAGNYLMYHHPQRVKAAFAPEYDAMREQYPQAGPGALWLRVKG